MRSNLPEHLGRFDMILSKFILKQLLVFNFNAYIVNITA